MMEVPIDEQIFRECPHFQTCSINSCPLDPLYGKRPESSRDPGQKCRAWAIYPASKSRAR